MPKQDWLHNGLYWHRRGHQARIYGKAEDVYEVEWYENGVRKTENVETFEEAVRVAEEHR